jgi:hypothetical protein
MKRSIKWGVFENDREVSPGVEIKELHVAPCNEEGELMQDHEISVLCSCHPSTVDHGRIVVHELIQ